MKKLLEEFNVIDLSEIRGGIAAFTKTTGGCGGTNGNCSGGGGCGGSDGNCTGGGGCGGDNGNCSISSETGSEKIEKC